ncbi:MAG: MBL fold metallo-hydrolase [Patescibacteria group bacterium]|nr:MBL fold metallo-hydrolase [Patescibacteria group bacterium]
MEIQTYRVGQLRTNCYLLVATTSDQCLIVDPGDDADLIGSEIMRQNLEPQMILATHGHYDHILGAQELQLAFNIPFFVHQKDEFLVRELKKRTQHWSKQEIIEQPPKINSYLHNGQIFDLGEKQLKVIHTPGHTPGGVCFKVMDDQKVLTGDTIFDGAVGRTDLSYSSAQDLKKSIEKLKQECTGHHAFPGHGRDFWL